MSRRPAIDDDLRAVPGLAGCSANELQQLRRLTTEIRLHAGHELMHEEERAYEGFIIVSGEAVVTRDGYELARLGAGDVVGEVALLDRGPRTATVIAETPLTVLVFERGAMPGLLALPTLGLLITARLAHRLRLADEIVTTH